MTANGKGVRHQARNESSGMFDDRSAYLMESVDQKLVGFRDDSRDTYSVPLRKALSP